MTGLLNCMVDRKSLAGNELPALDSVGYKNIPKPEKVKSFSPVAEKQDILVSPHTARKLFDILA